MWKEHSGLLKSHFSKVFHDWVSQRSQFVALSIEVPMLHEGVAVQQLEEDFTHFPTTATVVPTLGSNPHPYHVVRIKHGANNIPDRAEQDLIHRGSGKARDCTLLLSHLRTRLIELVTVNMSWTTV